MRPIPLLVLLLLASVSFAYAIDRPPITGIAYMRVYAADPAKSATFYGTYLGLAKAPAGGGVDRYAVNKLQAVEVVKLPNDAMTNRLVEIGFRTKDATTLRKYMEGRGVTGIMVRDSKSFAVQDPEGNTIVFVEEPESTGDHSNVLGSSNPHATSHRIIHVGFLVRSREREDAFYREILGFRPYWHGGHTNDVTDWVSLQVPDGTDWLEYMLNAAPEPTQRTLGVLNHFSLGVVKINDPHAILLKNGFPPSDSDKSQMGRDGKWQLNVFDPDLTRVEYMEFAPSQQPCCSPFTGTQPNPNRLD